MPKDTYTVVHLKDVGDIVPYLGEWVMMFMPEPYQRVPNTMTRKQIRRYPQDITDEEEDVVLSRLIPSKLSMKRDSDGSKRFELKLSSDKYDSLIFHDGTSMPSGWYYLNAEQRVYILDPSS